MLEEAVLRTPPATYFQQILRRFGDSAATRAAILEGTGVSENEIDRAPVEITAAQQFRQFDNMNLLFGEGWPLSAPELWRPSAHGALGVAVTSAPDVGAAMYIMAKYITAHAPNQRLKLIRARGTVTLRHDFPVTVPESLEKIMAEAMLLGVSSMLALLLGRAQQDVRFDYLWPEPAYGEKLKEALGGEVRWGAAANAVVVPTRLLAMRSPLANAALCQHAVELLEQAAAAAAGPDGLKTRVQRLLATSDRGRLPSSFVARSLGLSQRTFARRLADAGASYRDLVDAELKARASRWLEAGMFSKAEIGERLGFADATGFSRACRRWFRAGA